MTTEIRNLVDEAEIANRNGRLGKSISKLIEAFRLAYPGAAEDTSEDQTIIERVLDTPERKAFIVDTGSLSDDQAKAHVEQVSAEIQARNTCEPCTPTPENPTGVAEAPVLDNAKADEKKALPNIEDPDFLEKITALEKAQDAQALGVDVKDVDGELAKVRAKAASKTKAAPKDGE